MIHKYLFSQYREKVLNELLHGILPFWMNHTVDHEYGGFYGLITDDLTVYKDAFKSSIVCSRLLWTYAAAYRTFKKKEYLDMARHAYAFLTERFWDKDYSGIFWMLDHKGDCIDDKKHFYSQAFALYGLSEFARATGDEQSLNQAKEIYRLIETYSCDYEHKGYIEACSRAWAIADDQRLSQSVINARKSMNTHLHILEAYTNLLRVWDDEELKEKIRELVGVMIDKIIDPITWHFKHFFDEDWTSRSDAISCGHDIEGSWLLLEAAETLADHDLIERVKPIAVNMAQAVYDDGRDTDGALFYETNQHGVIDSNKIWWPQTEAVIGFLNAYQLTGNDYFFEASYTSWNFIEKYLIDRVHGEWFFGLNRECRLLDTNEKVGKVKRPYHNARACYEVIERLDKIISNIAQGGETNETA